MFGSALRVAMTPATQPDPGYVVTGVRFDGTDNFPISSANIISSGVVDGKQGTLSFWGKRFTSSGGHTLIGSQSNTLVFHYRNSANGNRFNLVFNNGTPLELRTLQEMNSTASWRHILCSWDRNTSTYHLYVDDVDDLELFQTGSNTTIDYTLAYQLGERQGGAVNIDAELADIYLNCETAIDFSVVANRRKFISATGKPIYLGDQGELPSGAQPTFFFSWNGVGDPTTFKDNRGFAQTFTGSDILTAATTSPT